MVGAVTSRCRIFVWCCEDAFLPRCVKRYLIMTLASLPQLLERSQQESLVKKHSRSICEISTYNSVMHATEQDRPMLLIIASRWHEIIRDGPEGHPEFNEPLQRLISLHSSGAAGHSSGPWIYRPNASIDHCRTIITIGAGKRPHPPL